VQSDTPPGSGQETQFAVPFSIDGQTLHAERISGIHKNIGSHTFHHTFGMLLKDNGEDVKTVHEFLRHANSRITTQLPLSVMPRIKVCGTSVDATAIVQQAAPQLSPH
jgi:hypothetical protein